MRRLRTKGPPFIALFLVAAQAARASDAPTAGAAAWFGSIEFEALIGALAAFAGSLLVRMRFVKKWRLEKAMECLTAAVRETYEEYVRGLKRNSQDGKLTGEERKEAMRIALDRAKIHAARAGLDIAKVYAEEYLPVLVEKIIGERKNSAGSGDSE